VLNVSRQRRRIPPLPSPYALQQSMQPRSRAPSIASTSSRATTDAGSSQSHFSTRVSNSGVAREYRAVSRRSRSSVYSISAPLEKLSLDTKATLEDAENIYVSDLGSQNAWPDKRKSASMAMEAVTQANLRARQVGRQTVEPTTSFLAKVRRIILVQSFWFLNSCRSGMLALCGGYNSRMRSTMLCTYGTSYQHQTRR
jgi:hypothetical protein